MAPSAQAINHEETKNPEKRSNFQQIVLYCVGPGTQNLGLREVDLEPSPTRGSNKINSLIPNRGEVEIFLKSWSRSQTI